MLEGVQGKHLYAFLFSLGGNMTPKRIGWIDAAKGIAIIAVVIYHTDIAPAILHSLMGSFQIPLFFFLAGYTFHARPVGETARRSAPQLLCPWVLLSLYASLANNLWEGDGSPLFLGSTVLRALMLNVSYSVTGIPIVGPAWFLLDLFCARLMLAFVLARLNHEGRLAINLLVFGILAGITSIALSIYCPVCLPLNLPAALMGFFFMSCGYAAHEGGCLTLEHRTVSVALRFAMALIVWAVCMGVSDMDLGYGYYRGLALAGPVGSLAAIGAISMFCMYIEREFPKLTRSLETCGRRSMTVYCIHSVEIVAPWYLLDSVATLPFGWVAVVVFRLALDVGLALAL